MIELILCIETTRPKGRSEGCGLVRCQHVFDGELGVRHQNILEKSHVVYMYMYYFMIISPELAFFETLFPELWAFW